jgi:hypothetical protein
MELFSSYTYQSRFIPEGVAEASQILLRDTRFTKITELCGILQT